MVVKKQFDKKNVVCRLTSSDAHDTKNMSKKKYVTTAVGYMDCGMQINSTKNIFYRNCICNYMLHIVSCGFIFGFTF